MCTRGREGPRPGGPWAAPCREGCRQFRRPGPTTVGCPKATFLLICEDFTKANSYYEQK